LADLIIDEASQASLRQRAATPEGKAALNEFIKLIAQWSVDIMTLEIREAVSTPEGMAEFMKLWPEIVDAYFQHLCNPRDQGMFRRSLSGSIGPRSPIASGSRGNTSPRTMRGHASLQSQSSGTM
jgi:hypothetical protein